MHFLEKISPIIGLRPLPFGVGQGSFVLGTSFNCNLCLLASGPHAGARHRDHAFLDLMEAYEVVKVSTVLRLERCSIETCNLNIHLNMMKSDIHLKLSIYFLHLLITSNDRLFGCLIICSDAIHYPMLFIDTSDNQVHWLIGTVYLSITISNVSFSITRQISRFLNLS